MSGHSKWAQIKRQKSVADQKRGNLFTKLARNITVAAREGGGDPETNFKLRVAIDQAKAANMPKDNIERAIKRGTGELKGEAIEEIIYEGFGPANSAFIIEALTDNKNRAVAEIRHIFSKHGGSLGGQNSVMWQFERKGVIRIGNWESVIRNLGFEADELELKLIELGADDIQEEEGDLVIYTKVEDFQKVKEALDKEGIKTDYASLEYIAKETKKISDPQEKEQLQKFFSALEECDDVNEFYTNVVWN